MKTTLIVTLLLIALGVVSALSVPRLGRLHQAHACNFAETCGVHDFKRIERATMSQSHSITIWLRQNNFAASCPSMLEEVSDPASPKYGHFLSFEELKAYTYDQQALDQVHAFLDAHLVPRAVRDVAPNGEWIKVRSTIGKIELLFAAEFHVFQSASRHVTLRRSASYTVPAELTSVITIVKGISDFPMVSHHTAIHAFKLSRQAGSVTPQLIATTYRMPNETDSTPKADMGVFEALGQSYSPADLLQFQKMYKLPEQKVKSVIGPNDPTACASDPNNCAEANLDVQYIMAMAQGAPLTFWSIADENGDIFLEWVEKVTKATTAPQVFSISYGGPEHLQNQPDMTQFSNEVCKLGLRGMTIFVASGDDGVAGYEARQDPSKCGFFPEYPANVPFVTTVGATMGPENGNPEVTCQSDAGSIITSGGGFSVHFAQPTYQAQAVQQYLTTGPNMPPTSKFAQKGRAYPDVASLGNNYNVVIGGQVYSLSGTSAASPVFCAMVTLVNGDREKLGKKPLGFLNPLLYKVDKSVYNDITMGKNNCCAGQSPVCCKLGFSAAKGWDATTGWGSLDFPLFAQALAQLP